MRIRIDVFDVENGYIVENRDTGNQLIASNIDEAVEHAGKMVRTEDSVYARRQMNQRGHYGDVPAEMAPRRRAPRAGAADVMFNDAPGAPAHAPIDWVAVHAAGLAAAGAGNRYRGNIMEQQAAPRPQDADPIRAMQAQARGVADEL